MNGQESENNAKLIWQPASRKDIVRLKIVKRINYLESNSLKWVKSISIVFYYMSQDQEKIFFKVE